MNAAKPRATLNALVAAYLSNGGIITKLPTKVSRAHAHRQYRLCR